jgi:hypothetical protein
VRRAGIVAHQHGAAREQAGGEDQRRSGGDHHRAIEFAREFPGDLDIRIPADDQNLRV